MLMCGNYHKAYIKGTQSRQGMPVIVHSRYMYKALVGV